MSPNLVIMPAGPRADEKKKRQALLKVFRKARDELRVHSVDEDLGLSQVDEDLLREMRSLAADFLSASDLEGDLFAQRLQTLIAFSHDPATVASALAVLTVDYENEEGKRRSRPPEAP